MASFAETFHFAASTCFFFFCQWWIIIIIICIFVHGSCPFFILFWREILFWSTSCRLMHVLEDQSRFLLLQGTCNPYTLEPKSDLINSENFDLSFQRLKLFTRCVCGLSIVLKPAAMLFNHRRLLLCPIVLVINSTSVLSVVVMNPSILESCLERWVEIPAHFLPCGSLWSRLLVWGLLAAFHTTTLLWSS